LIAGTFGGGSGGLTVFAVFDGFAVLDGFAVAFTVGGIAAVFALFVAGGTFGVMICCGGLGKPGDLVQRRAPAVRRS